MEHNHSSVSRRQIQYHLTVRLKLCWEESFFMAVILMHVTGQNTHMISYIHIYIYSLLQGFIANLHKNQLPVGLLAQLA